MANPVKGDVVFEALGTEWTLAIRHRAIVSLEHTFDCAITEIDEKHGGRAETVGIILQAGLLQHHKDVDEDTVASIIDDIGYPAVAEIISKAFRATFGEPADTAEATNGTQRPPGRRNASMRSASSVSGPANGASTRKRSGTRPRAS